MSIASPSYLDSFKQKARQWALSVVELNKMPVKGVLADEKKRLMNMASYIKKGIEAIFGTMDELDNAGLSILPAIPIAVVAASLAAISKWTFDYTKFKNKVAEQKRLEAKGIDPLTASNIVSKYAGSSVFNLNNLIKLLIIGGGLWFIVRRSN